MKQTDLLSVPEKQFEETLEEIKDGPINIQELEIYSKLLIKSLPKINRDLIRTEMSDMIVNISETPSTDDLSRGLAQAKGYRERLTEIYRLALRDYKVRYRCQEMLFDANNLLSKGSSADKRKGEATLKYMGLVMQTESSKIFLEEVEQMINNIKATNDNISRQVSIMDLELSLGGGRKSRYNNDDLQPKYNGNAEEITTKQGQVLWDEI